MAQVFYNGNGSTSGTVPVDPNNYAQGDPVTILGNTGALVNGIEELASWNTAADGSGTARHPNENFAMGPADTTLFAQWYTRAGLTNSGLTTHYQFTYDSSLATAGLEPARTNQVIAACEADYNIMSDWFGGIALRLASPVAILIANRSGGAFWGSRMIAEPGQRNADFIRGLMIAEVTEMFMWTQDQGFFASDGGNEASIGEGLSHFLIQQFEEITGRPFDFTGNPNTWLNSGLTPVVNGFNYGARGDYVNTTLEHDNGNDPATGCSTLFLYYLRTQLGFSTKQIITAASHTLGGVYKNLTGDSSDPFPYFKRVLDNVYPPAVQSSIPAPNHDNPYPLGMMSFWMNKNSFGADEVTDNIMSTNHGNYPAAFYLMVDGFSKNTFLSLGVSIPAPTGAFASLPGIIIRQSTTVPVDFENADHPAVPQRIRIPYDIVFTAATVAAFPDLASSPAELELDARLSSGGHTLLNSGASGLFELTAGANPYFNNIDPTQNNAFYLSQDLRVFTATPGVNKTPVSGGPLFGADSVAGAFEYIKNLVGYLNSNYSDTNGINPFKTLLPGQSEAYNGDSSVTPNTIHFNGIVPTLYPNYNFAIARVRLQGTAGPAHAAVNVKVFFRLWLSPSADTDYQVNSTYPSLNDARGLPSAPLVSEPDHLTIPFFGSGNFSGNTDYAPGGVNNQTIEIDTGKDTKWAYFGCLLNLYDPNNIIDGRQVQQYLQSGHHCLIAQIAYDDAPIENSATITMSPGNCDKLAQRNLQVTLSDNPGPAETHRIPQTFDLRPSKAASNTPGNSIEYPDELMIDWGNTPVGSIASIYWPQVDALAVLQLAARLYPSQLLSSSDAHTIQCTSGRGATYIPIPEGTGEHFAGLFTVDLPTTVITGQEFNIVVHRVTTHTFPGKTNRIPAAGRQAVFNTAAKNKTWRYIVGSFQVKIPVTTKEFILFPEENTLAIMKWRLQLMSPLNRWHKVLTRYISFLSGRVDGLGGDSSAVLPSPNGVPLPTSADLPGKGGCREPIEQTGKICEIIYNCFGDFDGFVLRACDQKIYFKSCEKAIAEIVLRACREGLLVSVFTADQTPGKITKIIIRC